MRKKMKRILFALVFLAGVLPGCSLLKQKEQPEEDVSLKIVKSGVKIEEVRFDEDLDIDGKWIYRFTVPVEITGTFQHDCTIPVSYWFAMERNPFINDQEASNWATDEPPTRVFEGELEIRAGTTGVVYYEGETDDALMNTDSTPYEHAWVAIRYDDGFISDNYAAISNPYFNREKYLYSRGRQKTYEEVRDIEPKEADGNVFIDEDSVTVEKTATGEEPGNPQHYTVSVTIKNDADTPVETKNLWVGCDYSMASPFNPHNTYDALGSAMTFMKGVAKPLGFTVQKKKITKDQDSIQVEFDMYNRYAGFKDSLMGSGPDWYQCFWIAICLEDNNLNDNYVIVPNPYYREENYTDEEFWLEHKANDIYRYTRTEAWNALFD